MCDEDGVAAVTAVHKDTGWAVIGEVVAVLPDSPYLVRHPDGTADEHAQNERMRVLM